MQFQVTKKRIIITLLLSVVALLTMGFSLEVFAECEAGIGLVVLLLILGCYVQSVEVRMHPVLNAVWMCISFVALPIVMVHVIEYLSGHEIALLPSVQFALNVFWCQLVYAMLFALTNHYRLSIIIGSIVCFLVGGVNYFVQLFRGSPFQLSDILAAGTAADVAGNYIIAINYELLLAGSITFLAISLAIVADFQRKRRDWKSIAASVVLLVYIVSSSLYFYNDKVWSKYNLKVEDWNLMLSYTNNGTMLSMAMGAKSMKAEKPEQYSKEAVQQTVQAVLDTDSANISQLGMDVKFLNTSGTAARYVPKQNKKPGTAISNPAGSVERPNIIAIMNESYADFDHLGEELRTNQPVTPFADALEENTIRGYALTSIFGGTTANAEFEFLTGFSMANVPEGSCPYQQYINADTFSIARVLKELGYRTFATHPYLSSGWNRTNVYPHLGFSESTFLEAYPMEDLVREFVSDREMYSHVLDLLRSESDAPLFLFGITMQNHVQSTIFDRLIHSQWLGISRFSSGDLLTRFSGDVGTVAGCAVSLLPSFVILYLISSVLDNFLAIQWIANAFRGIKIGVGILILRVALNMVKKMPKKPFPRTVASCAFAAMLVINFLSVKVSSITLMLLAAAVSLGRFVIKGGGKQCSC